MPDHWIPLAVVGRARRYPLARVARLSGLAGVAHVLVSLILGGVIVAVGLQFRSTIQHAQDTIVGGVLIATGIAFTALELTNRGHRHRHRADGHSHGHEDCHHDRLHDGYRRAVAAESRGVRRLVGIMVPFGAAASPDLTILPVFLAATAAGAGTAVGSLLAFAVVTIATIVALTVAATFGGYQLRGNWLDRWGNALTAATLLVIGTLIVTGTI
jgi:hypothetical protein